jgi:hypothetical protein
VERFEEDNNPKRSVTMRKTARKEVEREDRNGGALTCEPKRDDLAEAERGATVRVGRFVPPLLIAC